MSLLNLSLVTRALTELIARRVELLPDWGMRPRPTVSPLAPDQMPGSGLSFYLYHVIETPHGRNLAPTDPSRDGVQFNPMTLELHFQMSPVPAGTTANEMLEAQLLFGAALKVLHDQPELDDDLVVNGTNIFGLLGLDGAGNRFRVQMLPVPASEAVNYWTAGSSAMRLASYYAVSVIYLEPETAASRSGRVLSYGVSAFPAGSPFITSTEAQVSFTLPGGAAQTISTSPAAVPYGGQLIVTGANFTGDNVELLLRGNDDPEPRLAGGDWAVQAQPTRLTATAARQAGGAILLPGVYNATVRTTRMLSGRPITALSNASALQVGPAADTVTDLGGGAFRVDGGLFADPALDPSLVAVHVGAEILALVNAAPGPGEFQVVDADRIDLALPAGLVQGADLPLRIFVNGAETPPQFVRVP